LLIEWNLLRDEYKEIRNSFEFAGLYKQLEIKPRITFYNLFVNLVVKFAIKLGYRTKHFIKTQLKNVFNEEKNLEDNFQRHFKSTKIKISHEDKVILY